MSGFLFSSTLREQVLPREYKKERLGCICLSILFGVHLHLDLDKEETELLKAAQFLKKVVFCSLLIDFGSKNSLKN